MKRLDFNLTFSHFQLLAGPDQVALKGDIIVGQYSKTPLLFNRAAYLCEKFANHPETPAAILGYTKAFGPIVGKAEPGGTFQFNLCEWISHRHAFRNDWKMIASFADYHREEDVAERSWSFPPGMRILFSPLRNTLQSDNLFNLIQLIFACLPWKRIRFCPAEDCLRPYFVAHHLKQTFCGSSACIEWGARARKLEHWNRNKKNYLAERKQKREKEHGTRKTR